MGKRREGTEEKYLFFGSNEAAYGRNGNTILWRERVRKLQAHE